MLQGPLVAIGDGTGPWIISTLTILSKWEQQIASHYQPLTGAYDSNDSALLEYQVFLMKFTGINGVIIDWYGRENFRDYSDIHRNSLNLIKHIKKAGLKFAICYEDQSVKHLINDKKIKISDDLSYAEKEFCGWKNTSLLMNLI